MIANEPVVTSQNCVPEVGKRPGLPEGLHGLEALSTHPVPVSVAPSVPTLPGKLRINGAVAPAVCDSKSSLPTPVSPDSKFARGC